MSVAQFLRWSCGFSLCFVCLGPHIHIHKNTRYRFSLTLQSRRLLGWGRKTTNFPRHSHTLTTSKIQVKAWSKTRTGRASLTLEGLAAPLDTVLCSSSHKAKVRSGKDGKLRVPSGACNYPPSLTTQHWMDFNIFSVSSGLGRLSCQVMFLWSEGGKAALGGRDQQAASCASPHQTHVVRSLTKHRRGNLWVSHRKKS